MNLKPGILLFRIFSNKTGGVSSVGVFVPDDVVDAIVGN
jgi:hypothetical protein